jgi:hypothetical protein
MASSARNGRHRTTLTKSTGLVRRIAYPNADTRDTLGSVGHSARGVRAAGLKLGALSDLDNVAVGIADVAARLAVLRYRFRDELRSSTFP